MSKKPKPETISEESVITFSTFLQLGYLAVWTWFMGKYAFNNPDVYDAEHAQDGCCALGKFDDGYRAYREICSKVTAEENTYVTYRYYCFFITQFVG